MATKARQQYFADETSLQKDSREFSIADDIQQKINSVETGAQVNVIETVKVNGTALVPDVDKAVNVEVPDVIDNLYSTSTDDALSAKQGKVLYDYIQNIASRGRFLSNWNSATGLPMTNPSESPYLYKAGDYYSVSNVASGGGTNYRPDGSSYTIGQASTTVETEEVNVSDFYLYDGTNWLLLVNTARQIAVDSSLSTTSTNPVENRVITNALNNKQNILTAGNHIDITNNVISATGFQEELTAGENITIGDACTAESDMKGPCPSGFHVPLNTEWQAVYDIWTALGGGSSDGTNFGIALKLPFAGRRKNSSAGVDSQGTYGSYWSSTRNDNNSAYRLYFNSSDIGPQSTLSRTNGCSVRCFKNSPTVPTSSWTKLYGISIESGGIFWSSTEGLISMSSDGQTWITIADKNLGATTVWNSGDTLSEANCGKYYQRGNNYGFPRTGSVTTSSTQVDASNYGPGNYYSSDTFIKYGGRWDSGDNGNLWGGVTQGTWQECIHNVISAIDTKYTAGTGINIDANNVISATATPGQTYTAGNGINIDQNNEISADTSVVATQTDLASKQDTLTAGENIQIDTATNTISATDTTYNAGPGIEIGTYNDYSVMRGPCPEGYHIPTYEEMSELVDYFGSISGATSADFSTWLKVPIGGYRGNMDAQTANTTYNAGNYGFYWTSKATTQPNAYKLRIVFGNVNMLDTYRSSSGMVRPFKDEAVVPDSSWTTEYQGTGSAGIYSNATLGLISISSDGTNWITIANKNLGATTVYNYGDTFSQANCGNFYQWGNNYGFPYSGTITSDSTQVDTTGYGPGNYYSSSTFITRNTNVPRDWSSVDNRNLWGGETGVVDNAIINTGVLSVNGQTGDVIIQTGGNYTAGTGINISNQNVISADTTVVATQTDVDNKVSKGTNQINSQLFSIEDTYGNSTNFGPDYIRIDFNDGVDSGSAGLQRDSLGATADNKMSSLTSNSLALKDDLNLTQTTYAEDEITVVDNGYGTSETYQFSGGGNNQIARLKDIKTYTASTGINIDSSNNISNTLPGPTIASTAPTGTEGALWYDTTNDVLMAYDGTAWKEAGTQMKVLSYGHSTWQDFINAYNENAVVYCKASSNSNPGTGVQGRMAFMAFVSINSGTGLPTSVEFQYYRSRSDHNTAANQLDQVFVYKLENTNGGTWSVTERNTGAKAVAGTGINLAFGSGNMTISADTTTLATQTDLNSKQDTLVSGTNIKTINSNSLLGSGNITLNDVKSSATAPASPTEGMVWYDTTNDVLKTYDGSNWNECGAGGGGVEVFDITQYGTNTDWTDIITSCANNNTLTIILDIWEDDYTTQTGWVKWLVTEYDDGGTSGIGRISAIALFNLNGVGSAVPYPKSNKLVATFNATTKYCTGVTQYYTEFVPTNSGSTGNVLTKTAGGYEWAAPIEPTVISGDSGTTYTIKVSNTAPASGTASNIITFVTD